MGGGVMRAAAKVAGIGSVINTGVLRGSPVIPSPSVHSVCKASIPAAATLTAQNLSGVDVSAIEKPVYDEFVDWHMVGAGDEALEMSTGEPLPRVVFDAAAAPTFNEAKEATAELKDALDKVYLSSPKFSELGEQSAADKVSGLSAIMYPEPEEMESLLVTRTSVPKHALQAFEMLSRSSEVQNVVTSLASDPNIWNAMMENSAVQQFMDSHKSLYPDEDVADTEFSDPVSPKKVEGKSKGFEDVLSGFVKKMKLTVDNWVHDLSTCVQNFFDPPAAVDDDEKSFGKTAAASAFMGLALMVVMVVLMKRA